MFTWKFSFFYTPQCHPDIFTTRDSFLYIPDWETDILYVPHCCRDILHIPNCYPDILHILNSSPNITHVSVYYTDILYIPECYLDIFIPDFYRDIFVVFKAFPANVWKALHIKQTPTSFPNQLSHLYCSCSREVSFYHYMKKLYNIFL